MKNILLAALVAFSIGCATVGKKIDQDKVSQIEKGKTTKAEVYALLGNPWMTSLTADGKEMAQWMHSKASAGAQNFIPGVALIQSKTDMKMQTLGVIFNDNGIVENYTFNISDTEVKSGLITQ